MSCPNHSLIQSKIVPLSDLVIFSPEMLPEFQNHYVSITFFSDDGGRNIIKKSLLSGSVLIEASINGVEFGVLQVGSNDDGTLTLGGGEVFGFACGALLKIKATMQISNPDQATHAQLSINEYK